MAGNKKTGRKAGVPNLKRFDDYTINQYGVQITKEEERRLKRAAAATNRKRQKMLKEFADQEVTYGGRSTGANITQLNLMGREMDMMIRKRSTGLQKFRTRGEFMAYLKSAENAAKVDYGDYRTKLYKQNLIKAIENGMPGYNELTKGIRMRIRMMKKDQFKKLVALDEAFQIFNQYKADASQILDHINSMRDVLNLKPIE